MGCCLAIALILAMMRRLARRGNVDAGFAPVIPRRAAAATGSAERTPPLPPRAPESPHPATAGPEWRGWLLPGLAAGLVAHAGLLAALMAVGAAAPDAIAAWPRTLALGAAALLLLALRGAPAARQPPGAKAFATSLTLLGAELVDLHLLHGFQFVGPAAGTVDLLFHAVPLAVALAAAAQALRTPAPSPQPAHAA